MVKLPAAHSTNTLPKAQTNARPGASLVSVRRQEHDAAVPDGEAGRHMFEDAAVGNEAVAAAVESVAALGKQDMTASVAVGIHQFHT